MRCSSHQNKKRTVWKVSPYDVLLLSELAKRQIEFDSGIWIFVTNSPMCGRVGEVFSTSVVVFGITFVLMLFNPNACAISSTSHSISFLVAYPTGVVRTLAGVYFEVLDIGLDDSDWLYNSAVPFQISGSGFSLPVESSLIHEFHCNIPWIPDRAFVLTFRFQLSGRISRLNGQLHIRLKYQSKINN